jgi:formylglycine-generating enzyme required for sulfatase activity
VVATSQTSPSIPRSTVPPDPSHSEAAAEKTWDMIKDSRSPRDFDNFVETFPKSKFAPQALVRAMELRNEKAQPTPPAVTTASVNPGQTRTPVRTSTTTIPPPVPGASKINPKDGLTYIWIPPGSFMMGCSPNDQMCLNNEKPSHQVTISKGFWMGQTPVTNAAWTKLGPPSGWGNREVTHAAKSLKLSETVRFPNVPAVGMLWDEARAFCERAGGELPTEAEWEYAARAGSIAARYGKLNAISASTDQNGRELMVPGPIRVAQKEKNAWSLYDMIGDVWQWTEDRYGENYYEQKAETDPTGPTTGLAHVVRGGSFERNAVSSLRVSHRISFMPNQYGYDIGFRCVLP